ncbi:MAG: hypothetical protein HY231_24155 [Acidobacteria bacterium]|nr:hypothetical protein [Acidobacteriota bacterium]
MPKYEDAILVANRLVEQMRPFCERLEIAGSLRRRRPVVKDIEVVAIPKWEERPDVTNLFAEPKLVNLLFEDWANQQQMVEWIKPGTDELIAWRVQPAGLYWRGIFADGTKLDLFLTTPEKWSVIFTIRTGSAEFSHELATWAKLKRHTPIENGRILNYGRPVELADERAVFDYLGLQWVEPEQRTGKEAIRPKR